MKNIIPLLLVFSCRSPSDAATVDAPVIPGDSPAVTTVAQLRMHPPTPGTPVTLNNVVVVGHVESNKNGSIWVQDQGGGPYSGIHVFCNYGGSHPDCTLTKADFAGYAQGEVVNVSGTFDSFLLNTAPNGAQPSLEIKAPTITAVGATQAPSAITVDSATLAHDQYQPGAAADQYKGAYVHVNGPLMVTSAQPAEFAANCTGSNGSAGTTYDGFEAGSGAYLDIALSFYTTLTYCIPACGYPCDMPIVSQTFSSISGVVESDYNNNGQVYLRIAPVTDTDLPL